MGTFDDGILNERTNEQTENQNSDSIFRHIWQSLFKKMWQFWMKSAWFWAICVYILIKTWNFFRFRRRQQTVQR